MEEKYTLMSHRGFFEIYPENSLEGLKCAWDFGIIPEMDLRLTKDGQVIGFHDETLVRVTDAPAEIEETSISNLTFDDLRNVSLVGEDNRFYRIPHIREVLYRLGERPEQKIILDCKEDALFKEIYPLIQGFHLQDQVILLTNSLSECRKIKKHYSGIETLLWIKGKESEIDAQYKKALKDSSVDRIALILDVNPQIKNTYQLSYAFLDEALQQSFNKKYPLTLYQRRFDRKSLEILKKMGFANFATEHIGSLMQLLF